MTFSSNHWPSIASSQFEDLVQSLLDSEYENIKPVRGTGGDMGVDSFSGTFKGDITVYQVKFFLTTWNQSQKKQIKESLATAYREHNVSKWILIIPLDLTPSQISWFDALRKDYKDVDLDYWGFTKLRKLLLKHRSLLEEYFPVLIHPAVDIKINSKLTAIDDVVVTFLVSKKFTEIPSNQINPYIRAERKWIFNHKRYYLIRVDSENSTMNIMSLKKYLKSDEVLCIVGDSKYLCLLQGKIPMIPILDNYNEEKIVDILFNAISVTLEEE